MSGGMEESVDAMLDFAIAYRVSTALADIARRIGSENVMWACDYLLDILARRSRCGLLGSWRFCEKKEVDRIFIELVRKEPFFSNWLVYTDGRLNFRSEISEERQRAIQNHIASLFNPPLMDDRN